MDMLMCMFLPRHFHLPPFNFLNEDWRKNNPKHLEKIPTMLRERIKHC